jgi:hypothetical protein
MPEKLLKTLCGVQKSGTIFSIPRRCFASALGRIETCDALAPFGVPHPYPNLTQSEVQSLYELNSFGGLNPYPNITHTEFHILIRT